MIINFFAPSNMLGYGIHARGLMKALYFKGHTICLTPIMNDVSYQDELIVSWLKNQSLFDPKNPGIMIFHANFLNQLSSTPRIGFPVFEVNHFT